MPWFIRTVGFVILFYSNISTSAVAGVIGFESPEDRFAAHGFLLTDVHDDLRPQPPGTGYETVLTSGSYVAFSFGYDPCCGSGIISSSQSFNFLGSYFASAYDPFGILYLEGYRNGELVYTRQDIIYLDEKVYVEANFFGIDTLLMKKTSINQIAFDDWSYSRPAEVPLSTPLSFICLSLVFLSVSRSTNRPSTNPSIG